MASIKLKHTSGNGTILNSPAANPSSDITLKLPSTTGSAGQVLSVASANHSSTNAELEFTTPATPTDNNTWVKLQTTTITSNTANVTFNNSITGAFDTYNLYVIVFNETRFSADDSNLYMTIFSAGGEITSSEYSTRVLDADNNHGNYTGQSYYRLNTHPIGNNTSGSSIYEDVFGIIYMSNFKVYRRHRIHGNIVFGDTSSTKRFNPFGGGINDNTETIGVKIYPQNGQINTGKFTLYGVVQ